MEELEFAPKVDIIKKRAILSDISDKATYVLRDYGRDVNYKQELTNSSSNANFSIHLQFPNGITAILDRHPHIEQRVTIDFVGTSAGVSNLLQSGFDAPSAFGLTKTMRNQTITVQTTQINVPIAEILNCFMWYEREGDQYRRYMTPSALDNCQQFSDLTNTLKNVLGSINDSVIYNLNPRGAFPYEIVSNTPTSAQVIITYREPLFLSPFIYNLAKANGLAGINELDLEVDYATNPGNLIWSHSNDSGNTLTSVTVNYGTPKLITKFVSASGKEEKEMIKDPNKRRVYSYSYPVKHTTQITQVVTAGEVLTNQQTNSIAVKAIPNKMFIWVSPNYFQRSFNDPEFAFSIENLDVRFASKDSLSKASKGQLYEMNVQNGYRGSWWDWSGEPASVALGSSAVAQVSGCASYMCLKFGKDIQLPPNTFPGVAGTYDLQIGLDITNRRNVSVTNPLIYIILLYEGYMSIEGQLVNTSLSAVSLKQAYDIKQKDSGNMMGSAYDEGGSFFGKIGSFFKKALPIARKVLQDPLTKDAMKLLIPAIKALMGAGYSRKEAMQIMKQRVAGGELVKYRSSAGGELVKYKKKYKKKGGKLANRQRMLDKMLYDR